MQIVLSCRDMKSEHFGAERERSASRSAARFTVLVLIASLAALLLWLIGTAPERMEGGTSGCARVAVNAAPTRAGSSLGSC
jgi:hypothetical protein